MQSGWFHSACRAASRRARTWFPAHGRGKRRSVSRTAPCPDGPQPPARQPARARCANSKTANRQPRNLSGLIEATRSKHEFPVGYINPLSKLEPHLPELATLLKPSRSCSATLAGFGSAAPPITQCSPFFRRSAMSAAYSRNPDPAPWLLAPGRCCSPRRAGTLLGLPRRGICVPRNHSIHFPHQPRQVRRDVRDPARHVRFGNRRFLECDHRIADIVVVDVTNLRDICRCAMRSMPASSRYAGPVTARSAKSTRATPSPISAPASCATMNAGASTGRMPANESESERAAMVMAGFANEVDAVNQYAAPIQPATIHGASGCTPMSQHHEYQSRSWPRPRPATVPIPVRAWNEVCSKGKCKHGVGKNCARHSNPRPVPHA